MAIIKSGTKNKEKTLKSGFDENDDSVPFVAALDLLEAQTARLKSEEICAIALALYFVLPRSQPNQIGTAWKLHARMEGVSHRL